MVNLNIRSIATAATALLPLLAVAAPTSKAAPFSAASVKAKAGQTVADNYIIVLKNDVTTEQVEAHISSVETAHKNRLVRRDDPALTGVKFKYSLSTLKGYSGAFDESTIAEIKAKDEVAYIEEDKIMVAYDLVEQTDVPSWGLARVSSTDNSNLSTYTYDDSAGEGVTAYVIDTGCNTEHEDFDGRATFGYNASDDGDDDGVGHGTHVSGTIAGTTYGIAKKASIVCVKVLGDDGSGTNSGVIAGVQWAANDAQSKGTSSTSVANMSLGGSYSAALNSAVEAAISSGITFGIAAGNDGADASDYSPASVESAITVGAMDDTDEIAYYSNTGSLVDVFAPGTDITSAWIGSNTASDTISGTSMATPHVVGLAAYLIALEGLSSPSAVADRIKELANSAVTGVPSDTTDALIYNGA